METKGKGRMNGTKWEIVENEIGKLFLKTSMPITQREAEALINEQERRTEIRAHHIEEAFAGII